jgi:hypothetical protein
VREKDKSGGQQGYISKIGWWRGQGLTLDALSRLPAKRIGPRQGILACFLPSFRIGLHRSVTSSIVLHR